MAVVVAVGFGFFFDVFVGGGVVIVVEDALVHRPVKIKS